MELNDLKKTWSKMTPSKELDENQLHTMLSKRTKSLIERIDRNIKIGFVVLALFIILIILDNTFSKLLLNKFDQHFDMPTWLIAIGTFSNFLILSTFIYFAIRYYKVKKTCNIRCNLKEFLVRIIETLKIYNRLFLFALFAFLLTISIEFVTGMFYGFDAGLQNEGLEYTDISTSQMIFAIVIGVTILSLIIAGLFFFLRWGFRKLYGNYIRKLKATLRELEELD